MSATLFGAVPEGLPAPERAQWLRRQKMALSTLETHSMAGTVANDATLAAFRRYVQGEIPLAQAIAQAREQLAQEHRDFRDYLSRRNII
jgi:hypothetical protein